MLLHSPVHPPGTSLRPIRLNIGGNTFLASSRDLISFLFLLRLLLAFQLGYLPRRSLYVLLATIHMRYWLGAALRGSVRPIGACPGSMNSRV
jgi:hypothetical protein